MMGYAGNNGARRARIAVRIPTNEECDDFNVQDRVCELLYRSSGLIPFRRARKALLRAAKLSGTVLLDRGGRPAALVDLEDEDVYAFDYFYRDYIKPRAPSIRRRNRSETLERRRYLIALVRLAFPRELAALSLTVRELRLELSDHEPLPDQLLYFEPPDE